MAKFKIGDEVVMNDNADKKYRYTCKGFKGIVTDINDKTVEIDGIWVSTSMTATFMVNSYPKQRKLTTE